MEMLSVRSVTFLTLSLLFAGITPLISEEKKTGYFGSAEKSEEALIGIFYDLKQDQKHNPIKVGWGKVVTEFLHSGWDESVLAPYYKATRALYATSIWVPSIGAGQCPNEFGVQAYVKPGRWLVHYKGQVSPPVDGTYRFVGFGDDLVAVGINTKTVLVSTHPLSGLPHYAYWSGSGEIGVAVPGAQSLKMICGDWFEARKGVPLDLDVLTGESPGGGYCLWLTIECKGATYEHDAEGKPILPVFQVVKQEVKKGNGKSPPIAPPAEPWKCAQ